MDNDYYLLVYSDQGHNGNDYSYQLIAFLKLSFDEMKDGSVYRAIYEREQARGRYVMGMWLRIPDVKGLQDKAQTLEEYKRAEAWE